MKFSWKVNSTFLKWYLQWSDNQKSISVEYKYFLWTVRVTRPWYLFLLVYFHFVRFILYSLNLYFSPLLFLHRSMEWHGNGCRQNTERGRYGSHGFPTRGEHHEETQTSQTSRAPRHLFRRGKNLFDDTIQKIVVAWNHNRNLLVSISVHNENNKTYSGFRSYWTTLFCFPGSVTREIHN